MKFLLRSHLQHAAKTLQLSGELPLDVSLDIHIENAKDEKNGDFASNNALTWAKSAKKNPRALAEALVKALPTDPLISRVEIAGPGFINFFLSEKAYFQVIEEVLSAGSSYGHSKIGEHKKVHIEFVSSNPTGPLHVGHGRGAAYGASVANLLDAVGFDVHREYYINDAGRQMDILAVSVWLRYLEIVGLTFNFPRNAYQGDYVKEIAAKLYSAAGNSLNTSVEMLYSNVPQDYVSEMEGDKEAHIDGLISNAKKILGKEYRTVFDLGLYDILKDIREDLGDYRVHYDEWFSERSLVENGAVEHSLAVLKDKEYVYQEAGAWWFKTTAFGDDKDRVLIRANGEKTYFANDIAYHLNKLERGFELVIDVLGADHHGYVARVRAAMQALSGRGDALVVPLIQFVSLYRGDQKVPMSTRSGEFITLRSLRQEIGNDAARFFYVMRKADQAMDFDLELAKSTSNENPVYYIQYAYARICSVFRQLAQKDISWRPGENIQSLSYLIEKEEQILMRVLSRYPEIIENAALNYEPHALATYLRDLATVFHGYYNSHQFLVDDDFLRSARLHLISAVKQVLSNGLTLLGVTSPEEM
jgi:arginyl-tRNA synthetase